MVRLGVALAVFGVGPAFAAPALLFEQTFDGNRLDPKLWHDCYPYADARIGCMNEDSYDLEWYTQANVSVAGGTLNLTALRQHDHGYRFTSGMTVTGGSPKRAAGFTYQYGYAEVSAKFPPGHGMWPAFWMLPANLTWPPEIDAMEWQGATPTIDYATIHWGKDNHASGTAFDTGVDLSQDFHRYGVDWQADHVTWYFDGKKIKNYTDVKHIPNQPMYILLDLAVGGWIDKPDKQTAFPAVMQVQYLRVWSAKP
jgi:beta-glucanase (GH16 family)